MKIVFTFFVFITLSAFTNIHAQLIVEPPAIASNPSYKSPTAKALTELSFAVKQDAYLKSFSNGKKEFLSASENITTPKDAVQNITALSKYIKPNKFKNGFNLQDFVKNAGSITTMKQANDLIKKFESCLAPEAFVPLWKMQRSNWLSELGK